MLGIDLKIFGFGYGSAFIKFRWSGSAYDQCWSTSLKWQLEHMHNPPVDAVLYFPSFVKL